MFAPILDEQRLAKRAGNTRLNRRVAAQRLLVPEQPDLRVLSGQIGCHFGRMIGRSVINQENFKATGQIGQRFEQLMNLLRQPGLLVANRDDDAQRIIHAVSSLRIEPCECGGGSGSEFIGSRSLNLHGQCSKSI